MNLLADLHIPVDLDALYQQLGYPDRASVSEAVLEVCDQQVPRLERFIEPWGAWADIAIRSVEAGVVELDGGQKLTSARLASILGRATSLRVVVVTLGDQVGQEVRRLMDEDSMIDAMVFDAAGTVATSFSIRHLVEGVCREALELGRGTTLRYGPGYTGWELSDIGVLFPYLGRSLAPLIDSSLGSSLGSSHESSHESVVESALDRTLEDAELPVRLTEQLTMWPEKSVLNVVGITPAGKRSADVVPCRICDLQHCTARRAPYGGAPRDAGG